MAESSDQKRNRAGLGGIPQHEVDARLLREKTARLRELRLAQQAANAPAGDPTPPGGQKTNKKKAGKPREKAQTLSDWLTTRQNEGRGS